MAQKSGDEITLTQAMLGIGSAVLFIAGAGYIILKLVNLL